MFYNVYSVVTGKKRLFYAHRLRLQLCLMEYKYWKEFIYRIKLENFLPFLDPLKYCGLESIRKIIFTHVFCIVGYSFDGLANSHSFFD